MLYESSKQKIMFFIIPLTTVRGAIAAGPKRRTQREDRSWSEGEQVCMV